MKIICLNLNGIRAAARKGLFEWLREQDADIICLQETKAQEDQLTDEVFHPANYYRYFCDAEKKGYSGVAIYTKKKPNNVVKGFGINHVTDTEGRYIEASFDDYNVVSLYLPSGSSGDERQNIKYQLMDYYKEILLKQSESSKPYIICGDFNIVHKEIDIKNWKANQKSSGCLPEERAWLDSLFTDLNFVDAFRVCNKEENQYTWWSNRGRARENNVGWRIDYHIVSSELKEKIVSAEIYKGKWFSDHAPLIINYAL